MLYTTPKDNLPTCENINKSDKCHNTIDKPIIIALDYADEKSLLNFVAQIDPTLARLKIGKECFVYAGPAIIDKIHKLGFDIFLDLKFHDIPNTVTQACVEAAKLGVWMTNVHATGGSVMMNMLMDKLTQLPKRPLITAVTVLTSMANETWHELGFENTIEQQVLRLAKLTKKCGLDGVVCSALEAKTIRKELGDEFLLVTPGIRLNIDNNATDDQTRVTTPKKAIEMGASYLVIGRPITTSANPQATLESIIASLK